MARSPLPNRGRPTRALRISLAAVVLLLVAGVAFGGWHFSDMLLRPPKVRPLERPVVAAFDDSSVALTDTRIARSGENLFLEWPDGYGMLGELLGAEPTRVTRRFIRFKGHPALGAHVDLRAYPRRGDPLTACGIPFEPVKVAGALGSFPAWYVPGSGSTWMLFVHGRTATRAEALRMMPVAHSFRLPLLVLTYRNDQSAPPSPDHLYHLGESEWEDVEAGARYALRSGARRVILAAYSMGGLLDAPALDWSAAVDLGAHKEGGLAPLLAPVARLIASLRTGFRWEESGESAWPRQFHRSFPVLLFHGTQDETVPFATSEAFARSFGEQVTFVTTADAGHTRSWNRDPARYESALRSWLASIVPATGTAASAADLPDHRAVAGSGRIAHAVELDSIIDSGGTARP
jgi:hypothetical protein